MDNLIKVGVVLTGIYFPHCICIKEINDEKNELYVNLIANNDGKLSYWSETWNYQHTLTGIQQGEYTIVDMEYFADWNIEGETIPFDAIGSGEILTPMSDHLYVFESHRLFEHELYDPIPKRFRGRKAQPVRTEPKVNRNDPCSCGSGKKFKRCCGCHKR